MKGAPQIETHAAGTALFVPDLSFVTPQDRVDLILGWFVRNTGNIFFWEAPRRQVRHAITIDDWHFDREGIDTLVLSMGNWISSHTDLGELVDFLDRSRLERIVMVGAGAQAQAEIGEVTLTGTTRRLLDLVAERSASIGVRGDFTAAVLERHGIRDIDVIGCPSAFLIPPSLPPRRAGAARQIGVATAWHGHYRDGITELLAFGRRHDALLVEQSEPAVMRLAQGAAIDRDLNYLLRHYTVDAPAAWQTLAWARRRATFFTDADRWRDAMASLDLVIGSRFHGAVAALQAGTPALLLTTDARTKELADYLNLPSLPFEDFDAEAPLSRYAELADPGFFLATLADRKRRYAAFLARNGLEPAEPVPPARWDAAPREPEETGGAERILARFEADAAAASLPARRLAVETARRLRPLRTPAEGEAIDRAEFVQPYRERAGLAPPRPRRTWRKRQGVRDEYRHQEHAIVSDLDREPDGSTMQVYRNARLVADANGLARIVDVGCGSGLGLIREFGGYDTTGIEIEPALSGLRARHPARRWLDGAVVHPGLLDGDLVVCASLLEHLSEPDHLLAAMAASNARAFVLSTPALEILAERGLSPRLGPPARTSRVFEWTTAEFAALVGEHLEVVAHVIANLQHATQMCVAVRRTGSGGPVTVPELVLGA